MKILMIHFQQDFHISLSCVFALTVLIFSVKLRLNNSSQSNFVYGASFHDKASHDLGLSLEVELSDQDDFPKDFPWLLTH